jgi:hypothetical protein
MNCRARTATHQTAAVQATAAVTAVAAAGVFRVMHVEVSYLARGVDGRLVGKRVMFTTPFPRWLEQTVNLPGEGGRGQSSQGSEERGGGVRTRGSGHTREFD